MKKYKQLTSGQRYQIYGLKQAGLNAQKMSVGKSTISRECACFSHQPRCPSVSPDPYHSWERELNENTNGLLPNIYRKG